MNLLNETETKQKISINTVNLSGQIILKPEYNHYYNDTRYFSTQLAVKRISGTIDRIPIVFQQDMLNFFESNLNKYINILGRFKSYNNNGKLILYVECDDCVEIDNDNINNIYFSGYVCKQPVYRTTPLGREIVDLLIAVNDYDNKSYYFPCVVWGKNARECKDLKIGSNVLIHGRIQSRLYNKKEQNKIIQKTAYEISVCSIE